jgi:hypothetical protein
VTLTIVGQIEVRVFKSDVEERPAEGHEPPEARADKVS